MRDDSWPELVNVRSVTLQKYRLVQDATLSHRFAEPFRVEKWETEMLDAVRYRMIQYVWGEELQRQEVKYPADWWEAFKERWFPKRMKARWPVKYRTVTLEARALYPLVSMPNKENVVNVLMTDGGVTL